jgi:uncharacterized protein (TIGR02687 family)
MDNQIAQALNKLFGRYRIVFWYDAKQELHDDFIGLQLAGVEKIELNNNEFGVKYRILRELPYNKFLIYRKGPRPNDVENWLLDVQLAYAEFRTDQAAIWLSELELSFEFADVVQAHIEFFRAAKRKDSLKRLLKSDDTPSVIRLKMLGVCVGAEARTDTVLENLMAELAEGRDEKFKLISRCSLDGFLWEQMKRVYGYSSDTPGIRDFTIELFKSCFAMGTDGQVGLTGDALVFLRRWKDSRQNEDAFEALSDECAELLGIELKLGQWDFRKLMELDYFKLIDRKIISDLVRAVVARTVSAGELALWTRQRRQGRWYGEFLDLYEAIEYAGKFIYSLDEANLKIESMAEGIQRYSSFWFRLDQYYRKFTYHVRRSGQTSLMGPLTEQVENLYSNNYLLKINDRWQHLVDGINRWEAPPVPLQRNFFKDWVRPFLKKNNKVYVIISDALRYEIGDEFLSLIRQQDRYEASIESVLSMLPSYTQMGMAALLPNIELSLIDNESGTVLVDGQSSQGTVNRIKILEQAISKRVTALKAEELFKVDFDCRALVRDNDVVYIYHNRIDATGDKRESEERVFEAVEDTLKELILLVKKLTSANASNILVTSDHGFIYQNRAIDESDFSGTDVEGEEILFRDRRFVLGNGLKEVAGFRKFYPAELGLTGKVEVQIPKSINRLRLKGSGSRFVHGGASLQEVVIPVIKINKKRQSDTSTVEVDILRGASSIITSGQLAVAFYQVQPTTDKVHSKSLRAGIYTQAGELISDFHDLIFDISSDNPRERELQVQFVLARKADEVNGQEVILRLDEKLGGTSHYKEYKSVRYLMRRSFTSDFDF